MGCWEFNTVSGKTGTSNSITSVPQGGGALQGIGETFAPYLHTGTGNFTLPFELPPGRNGFQPKLPLVYSTGNGNSPFGMGWSLGGPGVSRKTSQGVPRYDDHTNIFLLSGAEDLIPIQTQSGVTRYRPRTEGLLRPCPPLSQRSGQLLAGRQQRWKSEPVRHARNGRARYYNAARPGSA